MTEQEEQGGTVIELLLREPEFVAWLEPNESNEPPSGLSRIWSRATAAPSSPATCAN